MSNLTTTNVDLGSVVHSNGEFSDDIFNATGAISIAEGTILARSSVSDKLVLFEKGGANGADVPVAVVTADYSAAGAGDIPMRPLIAGNVREERLIIAAGGDTVVDKVVTDALRGISIIPINVEELNILDNQ